MNENETDPRSADASAESSSPERGQSEQPAVTPPVAATPAAAPESGAPWQQPQPPQAPPPQVPQSPWQQPTGQHPAVQMPYGQHPGYPQQQPGYQQPGYQQPGYQQPAGYAQPAGYQQPYAQPGAYAGDWAPGGTATQAIPTGTENQPIWAVPVGGQEEPRHPGRGRRILVAGAAAVLIALAAGGVGAATAMAFDGNDNGSHAVKTGNSSVTRIVDRSSLAAIAAAVQDSVVSITTQSGEGSGVILSADGYVVTNNHVVATATGTTVTVIFADGKKASATIVGTDPRSDLAVVKVGDAANLKAATFGKSAKMQVGDTVLAIGSPLGLEGSVTAGIVSAKDRTIQSSSEEQQQQDPQGGGSQPQSSGSSTTMTGLLQTDAPINPGNSGGALVNTNGEVIGINSAIATQGSSSGNIGLGFAIPSDKVLPVAQSLQAGKKVSHPALGVSVTDAENGGALVSMVTANSAAAKAGLQQGDVITAVDTKTIDASNDLVAAVQAAAVGQKMTIDFTRDGAKKEVSVTLTESQ